MLTKVRSALSYANVMATLAVFIALGGGAWALARNSVGSREIKNGAVKGIDVKNNGLTGADVEEATLKDVPLEPAEPVTDVGLGTASAGCASNNQWLNLSDNVNNRAGYYRDPFGRVHLQGTVF